MNTNKFRILIRPIITATVLAAGITLTSHHEAPTREAVRAAVAHYPGLRVTALARRVLAQTRPAFSPLEPMRELDTELLHVHPEAYETVRLGAASYSVTGTGYPGERFTLPALA